MDKQPILLGRTGDSLRESFGKELTSLSPEYKNVVVLDADIAGGTGIHHFRKAFPDRFIQCGIAEQNMMAMAGGLAATGLIPIVTTFSVFMLRAIEQARLSIAYANMNVKIVASHPGLDVGPDGASAQCLEDLSCYRSIPNMVVISPCDPTEMEQATKAILDYVGPVYMRTGRSETKRILDNTYQFEIGKGRVIRDGSDVTIVACGVEVARSLEAAELLMSEGVSARVVNMSTIKPIDSELLTQCAKETGAIVTAEDHSIIGGLGGAVAESLAVHFPTPIEFIGTKDVFGESGEPDELSEKYELTAPFIVKAAKRCIKRK
ncbi:transketolase family protein [Candidatus Thioglobus sp.]|nr:transketolase family protein [Candidatus Thioglobus sp.]MDC1165320.1 transketolase family protein [Candidatus Thioglobus sp.]